MSWQPQIEDLTEVLVKEDDIDIKSLVVFNDDVNSFDHVIKTLINVCKHSKVQAEQCTFIIHYKGKCKVKNGMYKVLKPMKDAIIDAGINASIV